MLIPGIPPCDDERVPFVDVYLRQLLEYRHCGSMWSSTASFLHPWKQCGDMCPQASCFLSFMHIWGAVVCRLIPLSWESNSKQYRYENSLEKKKIPHHRGFRCRRKWQLVRPTFRVTRYQRMQRMAQIAKQRQTSARIATSAADRRMNSAPLGVLRMEGLYASSKGEYPRWLSLLLLFRSLISMSKIRQHQSLPVEHVCQIRAKICPFLQFLP